MMIDGPNTFVGEQPVQFFLTTALAGGPVLLTGEVQGKDLVNVIMLVFRAARVSSVRSKLSL